jgi:hypothetical protein
MTDHSLQKLEDLPGIGRKIAQDLRAIGVKSPCDLKDRNPQQLYEKLCISKASPMDRCVLYALRCATYYLSRHKHNLCLLKWWSWKD